MDITLGDVVIGSSLNLHTYNGTELTHDAVTGKAVMFNSNEEQFGKIPTDETCATKIDLCDNGLTIIMWLKLNENGTATKGIISNNADGNTTIIGVDLTFSNGSLSASIIDRSYTYGPVSQFIGSGTWTQVAISWEKDLGIMLCSNDTCSEFSLGTSHASSATDFSYNDYYIGILRNETTVYTDMIMDELKFWTHWKQKTFVAQHFAATDLCRYKNKL